MARGRLAAGLLVLWVACWPSTGRAATAWGTMITNVVTITMMSGAPDFIAYAVSYNMTCTVRIDDSPCMHGLKTVTPTTQAPGGALTYTIWAVNCSSSTSAFNINMTDRLPDNVMMMMGLPDWNGGSGGAWYASSGSNNTTWAVNLPAYGQGPPYYLRFVLDQLGPARSGFVSYAVTVR